LSLRVRARESERDRESEREREATPPRFLFDTPIFSFGRC
jgi:hypothetical protein